jgi:hypothetical protein
LKQAVQLLAGAAGELHLLFARDNVGRHFGQTCFDEFMFPHTIEGEPGISFTQGGCDRAH